MDNNEYYSDSDEHRTPKKMKKGPKTFNDGWLNYPEFSGWLEKVPNNVLKAYCTACQVNIHQLL